MFTCGASLLLSCFALLHSYFRGRLFRGSLWRTVGLLFAALGSSSLDFLSLSDRNLSSGFCLHYFSFSSFFLWGSLFSTASFPSPFDLPSRLTEVRLRSLQWNPFKYTEEGRRKIKEEENSHITKRNRHETETQESMHECCMSSLTSRNRTSNTAEEKWTADQEYLFAMWEEEKKWRIKWKTAHQKQMFENEKDPSNQASREQQRKEKRVVGGEWKKRRD